MNTATTSAPDAFSSLPITERMTLTYQVEQFLYHEADLLDRRLYRDWLALVAEDIHYWMPIRRTVTLANIDREFTKLGDMAYFDDEYSDLSLRVEKLYTGSSWSEDPPSRTRHLVSNVQVTGFDGELVCAQSAFHLHRSRLDDVTDDFYGRREDKLRPNGESFQLVQRHIIIDHTLIGATNMSSLF